jgi:uncharacterized protein DUF6984
MSDESQLFNSSLPNRSLRPEEGDLIRYLLAGVSEAASLENDLAMKRVVDMRDGGMGGIRFLASEQRSFGKCLVEAECFDSDGVLVSIALNVDNKGQLFELDFWKVNFSSLQRYPRPSDVSIKS